MLVVFEEEKVEVCPFRVSYWREDEIRETQGKAAKRKRKRRRGLN